LESSVGFWNESEVLNALLKWRVSTMPAVPPAPPVPGPHPIPPVPPQPSPVYDQRKKKALDKVNSITEIREAKDMLGRLVNLGYDSILDIILND